MPGIGECVPVPACLVVGGNMLRSRGQSGRTCLRYDRRNDDAGVLPAFFGEVGSWRPPFSVTQLISTLSSSPSAELQTRASVRRERLRPNPHFTHYRERQTELACRSSLACPDLFFQITHDGAADSGQHFTTVRLRRIPGGIPYKKALAQRSVNTRRQNHRVDVNLHPSPRMICTHGLPGRVPAVADLRRFLMLNRLSYNAGVVQYFFAHLCIHSEKSAI